MTVKVLLRTPNWIGDAVLALPAVTALAERPEVRLTVLASPAVHPVFAGLPSARLSPVDPRARTPLRAWTVGRALAGDDEIGIVLPASFSSALVMRLAGVPRRVGRAADGRSSLLTEALPRRPAPPVPLRGPAQYEPRFHRWRDYAELVEHVLGSAVPERYPLRVPDRGAARAARLLDELRGAGPVVGLNPGANGPARRWPAKRFVELGRALREAANARVVVLGGPAEVDLGRRVAAGIPGASSFAGRTSLETLLGVLDALDLFVTNDTGPMHLAAALGTPLLDLCGAADERVTGPRSPRARVLREHLFCSPCVRNACPFDLECMRALAVRRVLEASLLGLQRGRAA
ncbi:MAG: lipopolysaccharide heptosyltransferase II [Gemmatimonadota bacterium]